MTGGEPSFDWGDLVPRLVHPAQVAIVEAMIWMDHPLSATELSALFGEPKEYYLTLVAYHVNRLANHGALRKTGSRPVRGSTESFYFFPPSPNGNAAS